jgi:Recombinase
MASLLKLRQAARLIGVSPGKLYRAIADGRLTAAPGGGPGKPTLVSLEAVQTFCRSEGLRVPDMAEAMERSERRERAERSEHAERSMDTQADLDTLAGQYLARIMERQSQYFDLFLKEELSHLVERVVEQVVERLAERFTGSPTIHLERPERVERAERSTPAIATPKAAVLKRLRALQAEGLSLQAMANRFNEEGIPTLSGKGHWQKGTIGKLLARTED